MIITLLTDFGVTDYFVGAMKGVILSINPKAHIIDLTHEIEPQNIHAGAYTLANCFSEFPPKTIFTAIVDPGVGSRRRGILVETEKYYFIAPDNGILSIVLAREQEAKIYELTNRKFFREEISQTFHGRDIFAPATAWLSRGVAPKEFGPRLTDLVKIETKEPRRISAERWEGEIIHIDSFGNLITNFKRSDLPEKFEIIFNQRKIPDFYQYYSQASHQELFGIIGSTGYLEISAYKISAQKITEGGTGATVAIIAVN